MQMESKHEQAKKLRREGKSYAEIGEALNVSRQRAAQLVRLTPGDGLHVSALRKIPYKGLREWMLANKVSFKKLEELCKCDARRAVLAGGCTKRTIDAILQVTGLDYETCFEVD
jgi:hypothetical protein